MRNIFKEDILMSKKMKKIIIGVITSIIGTVIGVIVYNKFKA